MWPSRRIRSVRLPGSAALPVEAGAPPVGGFSKRLADVVIAGVALVLALPLLLAAAAAIRLTMGAPVLFAHPRVGQGGREFRCLKLRTMRDGAEELLARHLAAVPQAAEEWHRTQKLVRDPRVTRLGAILRKSSIDELPQLYNVLVGDMSCVGPRPVTRAELEERYGRRAHHYLAVRPGLTGLWQISGRSRLSYDTRVALDTHYAKAWSHRLDLAILLRTIPALLSPDETS